MIEAHVICDSIVKDAPRLTTFRLRYPKFIHGEFMTHRVFSRNASSSRAVKAERNLEEVRSNDRVVPVWWGKEQKGMASGEELPGYEEVGASSPEFWARWHWEEAAMNAAKSSYYLHRLGAHKSIVNRLLEPFLHINVIATSCEEGLLNFFGLRLPRDAQPEMRVLAEQMWAAWQESKPRRLENGQWHLPLVTDEEYDQFWPDTPDVMDEKAAVIKISVGRCAHVSYGTNLLSIEKAISLHDRLLENRHFSPFEHQATPSPDTTKWGNFPYWGQYRKMIPGENLTPLPEGYTYVKPSYY